MQFQIGRKEKKIIINVVRLLPNNSITALSAELNGRQLGKCTELLMLIQQRSEIKED
jgi:hypothetical protein